MMKHIAAAFIVLSTAASAFSQTPEGTQNMPFRDMERSRSQFSQYLMRGMAVGLEYANLNADMKLSYKYNGVGYSYSNSTTEGANAVGVSVNYGHLPRNDFGLVLGGTLIKKIEERKDTTAFTLAGDSPLLQIRPEGNMAFSFANGIYAGAGANLSWLEFEGAKDSPISQFGLGVQVQLGFIPARNFGMDLGYYVSRHNIDIQDLSSGSSGNGYSVNGELSYVDIKQLRARFSYMF